MKAQEQPDYPLLYSLRGFRYCDLLLARVERVAWQLTRNSDLPIRSLEFVATCQAAEQRATQTLQWAERQLGRLTIALAHLTLSRVALCRALLEKIEVPSPQAEIERAVAALRDAGVQDYLPRGLITRAWLRFLKGEIDAAQLDLDEAWEIAERGPMRLHMADIHLHRARLFHGVKPYPWASDADGKPRGPKDDLAAARKLVEMCGYWRRKEELEDAETAAQDWD